MATMLVAGLWHGAGWTFIIWGALHGLYLVISHIWRGLQKSLHWDIGGGPKLAVVVSILVTFIAATIAWVFFRAGSIDAAMGILRGMFGLNGIVLPIRFSPILGPVGDFLRAIGVTFGSTGIPFNQWAIIWIGLLLVLCWFAPNSLEFMAGHRTTVDTFQGEPSRGCHKWVRWSPSFLWAVIVAAIIVLSILGLNQASTFIYFQF